MKIHKISFLEHHSVYLAGKIRKNDWRSLFGPSDPQDIIKGYKEKINKQLTVTGPFFISCDHGCYHGEGRHGMGADVNDGCCANNPFSRKDVFEICKSQIDRAEILFARIDCRDCYGTIAEIGYAHAKGKDIVISFTDKNLKEEMWFIDKMQRNTGLASLEWITEQLISRFKED